MILRRGRPARALPVGVALLVLTGCAALPERNGTDTLTRPAVTEQAANDLLAHYDKVGNTAAVKQDDKLLTTIEAGPQLADSRAWSRIRKAHQEKYQPYTFVAPRLGLPAFGSYPMSFVVTAELSTDRRTRGLGLFERRSAGDTWHKTYNVWLPAGGVLPDFTGITQYSTTVEQGLSVGPKNAAANLVGYLNVGARSPLAKGFALDANTIAMLRGVADDHQQPPGSLERDGAQHLQPDRRGATRRALGRQRAGVRLRAREQPDLVRARLRPVLDRGLGAGRVPPADVRHLDRVHHPAPVRDGRPGQAAGRPDQAARHQLPGSRRLRPLGPTARFAAATTGAAAAAARSVPVARIRLTSAGSDARSANRFCNGSSTASTASATSRFSSPYDGNESASPSGSASVTAARISSRLVTPGLSSGRRAPPVGVGDRARHLAADDLGLVEHPDHPGCLVGVGLLILAVGVRSRGPCGGRRLRPRYHERLAVLTVEPRDVPGELDVLALVAADGHPPAPYSRMSAAIRHG